MLELLNDFFIIITSRLMPSISISEAFDKISLLHKFPLLGDFQQQNFITDQTASDYQWFCATLPATPQFLCGRCQWAGCRRRISGVLAVHSRWRIGSHAANAPTTWIGGTQLEQGLTYTAGDQELPSLIPLFSGECVRPCEGEHCRVVGRNDFDETAQSYWSLAWTRLGWPQ